MNKARLEYEIKSRGYSIGEFCKLINMSRSAFYRKCMGITQFTQAEIQKIVDVLELKTPMGIFFADKVS